MSEGRIKEFEDNLVSIRQNIKRRFNYFDDSHTKNNMNIGMNIEHIILDLLDDIHNSKSDTPKHETVEQWEKRTGEPYPDFGPVWYKPIDEMLLSTYQFYKKYGMKEKCFVATAYWEPEPS